MNVIMRTRRDDEPLRGPAWPLDRRCARVAISSTCPSPWTRSSQAGFVAQTEKDRFTRGAPSEYIFRWRSNRKTNDRSRSVYPPLPSPPLSRSDASCRSRIGPRIRVSIAGGTGLFLQRKQTRCGAERLGTRGEGLCDKLKSVAKCHARHTAAYSNSLTSKQTRENPHTLPHLSCSRCTHIKATRISG